MNNNKKKLFIVGGISLVLIAVIGITYAWLTQVLNGTKVNKIKAGTLDLVLDDNLSSGINLEYAVPQTDTQGLNNQAYTFKVISNGTMNAEYKLFLEDEEIEGEKLSDSNIKYNLVKNNGENNPKLLSSSIVEEKRQIDDEIIVGGETNEYELKLWIDSEATQEEVANKVFKAKIKLEAVQTDNGKLKVVYEKNSGIISEIGKTNDQCTTENGQTGCTVVLPSITPVEGATVLGWYNGDEKIGNPGDSYTLTSSITLTAKGKAENEHIKAVYTYNQNGTGTGTAFTGCLGGEEAGCASGQIVHKKTNTYPSGTIVKYEVADGVEKYFNVLYDNGTTLTMQQRENTVSNAVQWYSSVDNTHGPITALTALEAATANWKYVNDQTYTAGTTTFGTGSYATAKLDCLYVGNTPPNSSNCTGNKYTLTKTNVKARIITANEAGQMGCKFGTDTSSNSCMKFMYNWSYNTGTANQTYYWTMSTYSNQALSIVSSGYIAERSTVNQYNNVRAVVVVNK